MLTLTYETVSKAMPLYMRKSDSVILKISLQLQVVLTLCIKHDRVKSNHETAVQYACDLIRSGLVFRQQTAPTNIPWKFGSIFRSCHCAKWINSNMSTVLLPFVLNFHLAEIHNLIIVGEDVSCQRQKKENEGETQRGTVHMLGKMAWKAKQWREWVGRKKTMRNTGANSAKY